MAALISALILASSVALLFFWLRSACEAILRGRSEEYSSRVAEAVQLEFLTVRRSLADEPRQAQLASSLDALEHDYRALTYLLRNAATVHVGRYSGSERLLMLDFQLLRVWVRLQRVFGLSGWQSSLLRMTNILEYFGGVVGQRAAALAVSEPYR